MRRVAQNLHGMRLEPFNSTLRRISGVSFRAAAIRRCKFSGDPQLSRHNLASPLGERESAKAESETVTNSRVPSVTPRSIIAIRSIRNAVTAIWSLQRETAASAGA